MPNLVENKLLLDHNAADYRQFGAREFDSLKKSAAELKNKTVLHINAAPKGGGVAEILRSQIDFERDLGLNSKWYDIRAPKEFFVATKKIHNLLQGQLGLLSETEMQIYQDTNQELEISLRAIIAKNNPDAVVIHDPQPLPLITAIPRHIPAILRLHIDLSKATPTLRFFRPLIKDYSALIVSSKKYQENFSWYKNPIAVIPPAIDPLAEKNLGLSSTMAAGILKKQGIDPLQPLLVQVSRFDKWKDPLGVIEAFLLAQKSIPNLQLVLAGFFAAQDDPEATDLAAEVRRRVGDTKNIFLFDNPNSLAGITNDLFINALYTMATVVIQKSLKEGFGLTMTEAMWKGKAVVAGNTEGARLQIRHNQTGVIVDSIPQAARAIVKLARDAKLRRRLGYAARISVRKNFLLPKFIASNLALYRKLIN